MTLSRTWYSDGNVAISDTAAVGKSSMWALKCFMKGTLGTVDARGLWTVEGSSDGATAGMDATDRWTDTYTPAKLVWAAIGTARSWIVLKSPAAMGPYYLLIDCTGNTDGSTAWIMMWASKAAFTGGSITARPTSTKEWAVHPPATVSPLRLQIWDGVVNGHNLHYTADANGNFWYADSKNGTGIFHFCLGFQVLSETRSLDTQKGFTLGCFNTAGRGAFDLGSGVWTTSGQAAGHIGGRTSTDSASSVAAQDINLSFVNMISSWANQTVANSIDGTFDVWPVYVGSNNAAVMGSGSRGRLPDTALVGGSAVGNGAIPGSSAPSSGAQEQMVVGNILLPFSVPPNL